MDDLSYLRFDLDLRAAYRASLAAFCSACNASSRWARSAFSRSACNAASRSACSARSASRALVSAFSASRTVLTALRSTALAVRAVSRSASAGSAALARNFCSAAFLALAAASCRSCKSGFLKPAIALDLAAHRKAHQHPSTRAPAKHRCFDRGACRHALPSTAVPSAQERNHIGADVILAQELKGLVRRRHAIMGESADSLLPCRHAILIVRAVRMLWNPMHPFQCAM